MPSLGDDGDPKALGHPTLKPHPQVSLTRTRPDLNDVRVQLLLISIGTFALNAKAL